MDFTDIIYEKQDGIATITINRPQVMNAFRGGTVREMVEAFKDAAHDRSIGVVILTGAGERAFCSGGDQSARGKGGYQGGMNVDELHSIIRDIPKPVIAAVNGYAIGGGHVLHVICDLTIAADTAKFGQVGPRVGSVDPGFGTAYLTRVVGEKKAREIWYLCRQYSAQEALEMRLVNKVVPAAQLMDEARAWAREILAMSPTAIKIAKASFAAETDHIKGIGALGGTALALYYGTTKRWKAATLSWSGASRISANVRSNPPPRLSARKSPQSVPLNGPVRRDRFFPMNVGSSVPSVVVDSCLPVLEDGRLVGILTEGDFVALVARGQ